MKKNLLLLLLTLFCNFLYAQSYTLTRGLPLAEISGSGTTITGLGYNNSVGPLNIGFSFPFFENNYTQFYLASNGHVSFGDNNAALVNAIPESSVPNNVIVFAAIAWNATRGTPTLNYFTTGTAPNRILVINFKNVQNSFSNTPGILQMQLYETSGKIEIHYTSFSAGPYWKATIGIENAAGSLGITNKDLNNKNSLALNNEAIRFGRVTQCTGTVSVSASSNILCQGSSTLTANVSQPGSYTYQWFKNSVAIAGAINNSYEANSAGIYFVRITGSNDCISQSNDTEIVATINPTISPSSSYVCNTITLGTLPSGSYSYRWLKNNTAIDGQTSASIIPQGSGSYKVEVSSGNCSVSSNTTTIAENNITTPYNLNRTVCNSTTLEVGISSLPSGITYSWLGPNSFSSEERFPVIPNATVPNSGIYTITVNFGCNDIKTATTNVIISPNTITLNPITSTNFCGNVYLSAETTYTPNRTYSWAGPNGFSSTIINPSINNASAANEGVYTLTVNFGCGDIQTATTNLTLTTNNIWLESAASVNICKTIDLYATSTYTSERTYLWTGPNGFSSTTFSPSITNVTEANEGFYTLTVNFGCGQIKTATKYVTVNPNSVTLTSNYSARLCGGVSFNVYTNSNATYAWTGPNNFTSAVSNPYIPSVTNAHAGIYTVTVNFGCGDVQTATTKLTVSANSLSLAVFTSATICGTVNMPPNGSTTSSMTYAWVGSNGFSSTERNLKLNTISSANAGIYTLTVNFGCNDIQTATTRVTVNSNTLTLNSPITANLCGNLSGYASASETPTRSFAWAGPNGFISNSASLLINNVTNANAGVYSVTVNFGCGEILTATTYVNIKANTTGIDPSVSAYACGNINLSSYATYTSARTYSWTGPNGFSSSESEPIIPMATDAKAGVYTLTVNFGCSDIKTSTTQVTVTPNVVSPNPTISASLCGEASLSAYTSNINVSYVWSGPNGFISTSYNPIIYNVSNAEAGIYTVTVNFGCGDIKTATTRLTVNPINLSVSHNATAYGCPGKEVEFNVAWYSPRNLTASYNWTGPGGFTSTKQNPSFALTENSAGTYTITANFGSCGISTATTTIAMYPPVFTASSPDYFSNTMLCESNSINLVTLLNGSSTETIPGTTYTNYTWNGPDNFVSHERNPTIENLTAAKAGFYTVTVDLANGCKGVYISQIAINVTKDPELTTAYSATFTCAGSPAILLYNTNPLGNTSVNYLWTGPNGFSSTEPRPTVTNLGSGGLYTLTASFTGGCAGTYTSVVPIFNIRKPITQLDSIKTACFGQDLTLSSNNAASNSNLKYVWTGPNHFRNESSYALVSYTATADMAGVYTLTVTDISGACQEPFVATQRIILNDCSSECTLTASSSSSAYYTCPGGNVFLSSRLSPIGGNYSFAWTGPNGFTSNSPYATIANLSESMAGVYTITATSSLCSGILTATTFVGINTNTATPVMNFSVGNNLCEGGGGLFLIQATNGSILSYSFTGPNDYKFYGTNTFLYSAGYDQIANLTTNMGGIYAVNATFQKACSDSIYQQNASLNVVVNPRPSAPNITGSPTTIEQGETTTLTASACNGINTLKWFNSSSVNPLVDKPPLATSYWAVCESQGCLSFSSNRVMVTLGGCPQQFVLINPNQNYSTGIVLKRAKADNGNITATNFVTGNANVTYQAKSILLNAGFKADNGTVFKAETGGCN